MIYFDCPDFEVFLLDQSFNRELLNKGVIYSNL